MSPGSPARDHLAGEANSTVEAIAQGAKRLTRAAARFTAASASPPEVVGVLQTLQATLEELASHLPTLQSVLADATRRADKAFHELDADIRDAVSSRGWRCEGPWPTFYIERSIPIHIDPKVRSAVVGTKRLPSATVERILEALGPQVGTLLPKGFSPEAFIRDLALAYDDVARDSQLVPIFEVYRSFVVRTQGAKFWRDPSAADFVSVSADQFRARLTVALEHGAIDSRDGRQLRLLPPLDPKEGLMMYQPAEQRFSLVGRIEFLRVG
jgi:hypothetical protein